MPIQEVADKEDIFEDAKEGKSDLLELELHKEEKDTKPPAPLSRVILIFTLVTIVSIGLAFGISAIIRALIPDSFQDYFEWVSILLMMFGGLAIISGGIAGFWGGQRNIPIRLVSPSDASVVGKGLLICGYIIEDCLDGEIELTIYRKKDMEVIFESIIPVQGSGIFYTELDNDFSEEEKTTHLVVEAWMVSTKAKKIKFAIREKKLENMNLISEGLKIGTIYFFSRIYQDFDDKAKIIFDPKRKEKGVIENVTSGDGKTTNIFFPSKSSDEKYVPFSIERVEKMRTNAFYFDIKRSRRVAFSLVFFLMGLAFFIFPLINAFALG